MKWYPFVSGALVLGILASACVSSKSPGIENPDQHKISTAKETQMTVIEFSRIGPVKLKKKEDEYVFEDWTITYQLEGQPLDLDIHLKELDDSSIAIVNIVLTELEKIRDIGQSALVKNFEEGDVVKDYIEEWNEDIFFQVFEEDEFQDFIKDTAPSLSIEERLLSLLRLVRVGIYRNSKDHLLTLDFAFGHGDEEGFRQHMFVLWLNEDYELVDMGIEG